MIFPLRKAQRPMEHCEKSANNSLEINIVCYAILSLVCLTAWTWVAS